MNQIITPKEKKIILENFTSLSTLQGITYILPTLVLPYLIRIIGMEKFGLIAFAQAFIQYFTILVDYGFNLSAVKKISLCGEQNKKTCVIFSSVMTAKAILTVISLVILILILKFVPRFHNNYLVYLLSFGSVIGNAIFPAWFFQGKEKMKYIAAINISAGVIYATCIFVFVRSPSDYLYVPAFNSLFFLVTGCLGLFTAFKKFKLKFIFQNYTNIKEELKDGWNIFISILAINAYTTTRVFAVGLLTNNIITGYYSAAERIANIIQTFPLTSFSQAIYPRLSKIFAKNKNRALNIMHKIQTSITLIYIFAIPAFFILAPTIVRIVCAGAYEEVVLSLRLLLISVFFIASNALRVQFLLVCAKTKTYSRIHITAATISLPLIFIFTHFFSYVGTAFVTLITEAGIFLATFIILKTYSKKLIR